MVRLTPADVIARPWTVSRSQYQAVMGVHRPYIAEISPFQYSRMSGAAKRRYDAERAKAWDASAACQEEWERAVIVAWIEGKFLEDDPDVHQEARSAIWRDRIRREEAERERRLKEALDANRIRSVEELNVGDRVYVLLASRYAPVVKKNKKTVGVEIEPGRVWKVEPGGLQRRHYNDVVKLVEGAA